MKVEEVYIRVKSGLVMAYMVDESKTISGRQPEIKCDYVWYASNHYTVIQKFRVWIYEC